MNAQLLSHLQERAGNRGFVHVREEVLIQELKSTRDELAAGLQSLENAGTIRILSPLPYLVLRFKKWSGKTADVAKSGTSAYSHSKQLLQSQQLKDSYRPEDASPATRIDEGLLGEILETLGETDARACEKAVELYSPYVIRTALDRVRRARGIRKSRTALFRHLLPRLARENQSDN